MAGNGIGKEVEYTRVQRGDKKQIRKQKEQQQEEMIENVSEANKHMTGRK